MDTTEPTVGTVLIVDDDKAIRETLTMILEDEGYRVNSAPHGRDALSLLRQGDIRPQLILLDLMMPVMSGWEFRAEQSRDPDLASIPVVVLSADRDITTKATSVAANGYLSKPVDLALLLATVSQYCDP
jgi:CheY-like chemotaxis protein